jgi:hypothetical protein
MLGRRRRLDRRRRQQLRQVAAFAPGAARAQPVRQVAEGQAAGTAGDRLGLAAKGRRDGLSGAALRAWTRRVSAGFPDLLALDARQLPTSRLAITRSARSAALPGRLEAMLR